MTDSVPHGLLVEQKVAPGFEPAIHAVAMLKAEIRKQLGKILAAITVIAVNDESNVLGGVLEKCT